MLNAICAGKDIGRKTAPFSTLRQVVFCSAQKGWGHVVQTEYNRARNNMANSGISVIDALKTPASRNGVVIFAVEKIPLL